MAAFDIVDCTIGVFPSILTNAYAIDYTGALYPGINETVDPCPELPSNNIIWTIESPVEFSNLEKRDPVLIHLEYGALELLDIIISVRIVSLGVDDVVFQNGRFSDRYQAYSTTRFSGTGKYFSVRRTEGWPVEASDSETDDIQFSVFGGLGAV